MSKLQNNFTTPEQSMKLLELGLPADSADCYLQNESQDPLAYVNYTAHIIQPFHDKRIMFSQMEDFLPCWSVGRLIEIYCLCMGLDSLQLAMKDDMTESIVYMLLTESDLDFSKLEYYE